MTTDFAHLHAHSEYSLLDGKTRVTEMPLIAKSHGQSAIGLTDHGTLGGALKFWESAKEAEVKGIFGVEAYVTPDLKVKDKDSPTWHLILLAQNRQGLENLFALSKIAWIDGFYRRPRIDHNALDLHSEGIIALSACMASETSRALEKGDLIYPGPTNEALEVLRRYQSIYGDRFYVELQPGNPRDLNACLSEMAEDLNLKTVVTVDSHYDHCSSKAHEEMLLTMQQISGFKKSDRDYAHLMFEEAKRETTLMNRINKLWPNRGLRFDHLELHLMNREEVVSRMNDQGFYGNDLADTSLEIAERCEQVEFKTGVNYLPKISKSFDSNEYLEALAWEGLEDRGLDKDPEYRKRLEFELGVIKDMDFSDYFLVVWDIINEARNRNIYVGPGRGSSAGSLVCYALKITNIDPIKYKLLFFRFLDPSRPDWPDIDMDFEHRGRDEMKDYVEEKYGERYSLCTYSQFRAKGLIASVGKVLGLKESEVRAATKHFSTMDEYESADALKGFRAKHPEILPIARDFEGQISGTGMHAAGVVIANRPMETIVPIESRTDPDDKKLRVPVTGFDMDDAEKVGLLKFDFLGLANLSIVHDAIDLIKERHGIDIDWENLEPDDKDVLEMLNGRNTIGVFQMESGQFANLISDQGIHDFSDIYAANALVRPGAYETVAKSFTKRKHGLEDVDFPHEDVEEWLGDTYGLVIYQEQLMALSVVLGGFTWGEANILRKIIGKKRDAKEFEPFFNKWIENAGAKIGKAKAKKLWSDFEKHAGYSFNLSHSVAYSYISYVTAYLKYYYPLEYIYALLRNEKKAMTRMTYLLEAKRMGIKILPPDVNHSSQEMMVDGDALRFGLSDIKNVGFAAADHIIESRPFKNWDEWNDKIIARKCNSRVVESLVAVNAFSSIEGAPVNSSAEGNYMEYLNFPVDLDSVSSLGIEYDPIDKYEEGKGHIVVCGVVKDIKRTSTYVKIELEDITGQLTCFGSMDNDLNKGEVIIALIGDKSMMGYARVDGFKERIESGNLDRFEKILLGRGFDTVEDLRGFGFGDLSSAKPMVIPLNIRRITTKTGKKMGFINVTDGSTIRRITVFPKTWEKLESSLIELHPICVKLGKLDDGGTVLNDAILAEELLDRQRKKLTK